MKEAHEPVRKIWKTIERLVDEGNVYVASCEFKKANNHRMDKLAECLVELGKTTNPTLKMSGKN